MYRSTEELFGVALDSANSSKRAKSTMSKSESVASSFGQCAREILTKTFKLSSEQHHHLIEQFCEDEDNELAKLSDSSGTSMVSSSQHNAPSYITV
uniref:RGS domain-containing protein n=1 Tax=Steinernema glaseri TaxID=37863 RepID=A0A1I8A468_9BILA